MFLPPPWLFLILLGLLGFLLVRDWRARRELAWRREVTRALQVGSERLASAQGTHAIVRVAVEVLGGLRVAPHIAFVAYQQGVPCILAGQGGFGGQVTRALTAANDSRSVQADHWVAAEVLTLLRPEDRRHTCVLPVYDGTQRHLGLLVLARAGRVWRDEERETAAAFARLLGAQLGQWQAMQDLRDANDLTLRSLGAALERRDDGTGGHTTRVVGLSVRLARALGWDEDRVKALRWGAYLHDMGKLGIPDRILYKHGPLDPEERRIIQSHTTQGYDLLQDLHFLPAETLDLVRYHHERWDGSGYPAGLCGENIPEAARLFAIVDVYDALTSARPYKPAWSRERALQEIGAQAGRHFDPHYVDAFLALMTEQDDVRLVS
ncbi:HD-GYP domain-containing protein [Deinococcus sp. YIM 77859]|uniref:HD-GYP domain-containing protein n=1 Tax=Deinococcus sp. YIM 77859 TaxID=1540221 RepID=UPI00068A6A71|nr:HD domain-containing phosphohydrolase [Deinococcus sp. YIM 77859]